MGKGTIDKRMGGRYRDKDVAAINVEGVTQQYIQDLINNSTFDWSQITGSVTNNQELKSYIDNLLELFALNQFNIGDEITQEMLNYFQSILDQLTITATQITDLDTINQDFKTYIDNQIAELTSYIQQLVIDEIYSAELKQYIDNSIANLQTILEQLIANTVNTSIEQLIEQITNQTGESTRLISGSVTWLQNLDFFVSPLVYQILNQRIESAEIEITIPANVSNDPMFALIVGDVFGNISFIQGIPAPAPSIPLVNSSTQIIIQTVYIPALGTEPGIDPDGETTEIVNEVIYDENLEWATSKTEEAGVVINLESIEGPQAGAKHISMTFAGTPESLERGELNITQPLQQKVAYPIDGDTSAGIYIDLREIFPDHRTNSLRDGKRYVVYYRATKSTVKARLINQSNNAQRSLFCSDVSSDNYAIVELGFAADASNILSLNYSGLPLAFGDYILEISGFTRYEQVYSAIPAALITPGQAFVDFTRAEAVEAKGGNISLFLKSSLPWLNSTGLLFELFNGAAKVGSLAMLAGKMFGFNSENPDYQKVIIPVSEFNPTDTKITRLVIRPVNAWPDGSLFVDNVVLQTGIIKPASVPEKIEEISFEFRDITEAGQIYILDLSAYYKYKVLGATLKTDTGEINALVSINEQPITGLNCAVTNVKQSFAATGDNHLVIDDELKLTIVSIANDVTTIIGKIKLVRE